MRKIHETDFNSPEPSGESASRLIIYAFDNEDEFWEISELIDKYKRDELEEMFNVEGDYGYVMPGARFTRYSFAILGDFVIVTEMVSYNV